MQTNERLKIQLCIILSRNHYNDDLHFRNTIINKRKDAIQVLNFIESFTPRLSKIEDTEFVIGLERKIKEKYNVAQEIITSAPAPL